MKIFISSTYKDLKQDRVAVAEVLNRIDGVKAVLMEDFFASYHPPIKECLDRLADCDAVILLLGSRYGSIDSESGLSVTEVEYRTAKDLGIPVIPFLKKEGGTWKSIESDDGVRRLHEAFKQRVEQNALRVAYETAPDLKYEVEATVHNFRAQNGLIGVRVPAFGQVLEVLEKSSAREPFVSRPPGRPGRGRPGAGGPPRAGPCPGTAGR